MQRSITGMWKNNMKCTEKILQSLKEKGAIKSDCDNVGDGKLSVLFPFILSSLGSLLTEYDKERYSEKHIKRHRKYNIIIRKLGPLFLKSRQIFEDKNTLLGLYSKDIRIADDRPTIFVSNHGFHDDALGTLIAARTHAYYTFGSLPVFYNSIDGIMAYLNGLIVVNRKVKASKKASVEKAKLSYWESVVKYIQKWIVISRMMRV